MATVDQRVVEMKFDNTQFEAGVKQTITSLDELKTALNLNTATTGINTLQGAFDSFKIDNIQNSLDQLTNRFSTLGIVGMTAIQNITNKLTDLATNKISSAIGQIKSGGWSRASSIAQSRFTLTGLLGDEVYDTTTGLTKVEEAFNNASDAVDGTAYSLSSAVSVASQLAASGVEVGDEMSTVLKSISGVAAMTGDTYDSIGNIYTTVAGNGRLMGMQLTQLSSHGLNAAATIADYLGSTEAEVRDMVSKGEISFQTFSDAMYDAFGEHAKDANKTFSGSMDNIKSALSRIGALFASGIIENESVIDFLNDVRVSINNIKKAIEPLEEPFKNLMTNMSKVASGMLNALDYTGFSTLIEYVAAGMNSLSEWFGQFVKVQETLGNVFGISDYEFAKSGEAISSTVEKVTDFYELLDDTQKALADKVWSTWMGDFGNGADRVSALGDEYEEVQNAVDATAGHVGSFNEMCEALYYSLQEDTQATTDLKDAAEKVKEPLEGEATLMGAVKKTAEGVKTIFSSIVNVFKAVKTAMSKVFSKNGLIKDVNSFSDVFLGLTQAFAITDERMEKLEIIFEAVFNVIKIVKDIFVTLVSVISNGVNPAAKGLFDVFLDILVAVAKVINKFANFVKENRIVQGVIETLGKLVFGAAANIKYFFEQFAQLEAVQKIRNKLKDLGSYIGDKLSPIFEKAKEFFGNFMGTMEEGDTSNIDSLLEGVNDALEKFIELCESAWGKVDTFIDKFNGAKDTLEEFGVSAENIKSGSDAVKTFSDTVKKSDGVTSFIDNLSEKFGGVSTIMETVTNGINTFVSSIADSLGKVLLVGFGATIISLVMRLSTFVKSLTEFTKAASAVPKAIGTSITMIGSGIKTYFVNKSKADVIKNYAIAIGVLAVALIALAMVPAENLYKALFALSVLIVVFGTMIKILTVVPKNMKPEQMEAIRKQLSALSTILISFAASLLLLSLSMVILTNNVNWDNWIPASIALASFVVAMTAVVVILSKLGSNLGKINVSALTIVAMAASIWLMAKALQSLTELETEGIWEKIGVLGVLVAMMAALLISSHFGKLSGALSIITMILAIWAIEQTLKWVIDNGVTSEQIALNIDKIAVLLASLIAIAFAIKVASTNASIGSALTVLAFSYMLIVLVRALLTLSSIPLGSIIVSVSAMVILIYMLHYLLKALEGEKKNALKASVAMLVISIAMMALVGVMKLIGLLKPEEVLVGIIVVTLMTAMFSILMLVCQYAEKIKASTIWALVGAIAAMVIMVAMMSLIQDKASVIESMGVIGTLLIAFGISLYLAGQNADKIKLSSLITLTTALAIAAAAVYFIASLRAPESIGAAGLALAGVLIGLAAALVILNNNLKKDKLDKMQLIYMAEFILMLVAVGAALALVIAATSKTTADKAVIAIFGVLAVVAVMVYLATYLIKNLKGTSTTVNRLILLAEMIVSVVFVAAAISMVVTAMNGVNIASALVGIIAIIAILAELVYLTKVVAEIKSEGITVKKLVAIGEMMIMIIAVATAISIVATAVRGATTGAVVGTILSLSVVLLAIAAFLVIVSSIRTITIGQLAALIIMIFMLKSVSSALTEVLLTGVDWKKMIAAAVALGIVLLSISASLAILTAIGSTGIGIVAMLAAALVISVVLLAIAESIKIFSEAMYTMVEAVSMLSEINYDGIDTEKLWDLVKIMAAVSGIAVLLVVVLGMLSPLVAIVAVLSLVFAAAFAIVASNATDFLTALNYVIVSITSFVALIASLSTQMDTIKENIIGVGAAIGTGLATAISTFITTMADNIESLKESVKTIMITIATAIAETAGAFAAAGIIMIFSFVNSFISTLNDYLPEIIESLADLIVVALNSLSKTIYNHADEIQDAVQTFLDVMTVKIKESDSIFSYMIGDTDYLAAKLRLTDKAEELGEDSATAMQEGADSTGGLDLSGKLDNEENDEVIEGETSSITDKLMGKLESKLSDTDIDVSSYTSFDMSNMEVSGFDDMLGDVDLTDSSSYESMITSFTNGTTEDFGNAGAESADAYFNEYESGMSAYEFAKYGAPEDEDVIDTQEEAGALGGSTYYDSYVEEVNNQNGSEVVDGIVNWTTNEEAVATLKSGGEEGATNYIEGFKQGIYNMSASLKQAVVDAINGNVVDATAEATESASPSKKAKRFGKWWDMGFAGGVLENSYLMSDAITESFSGLDSDMESSLAHINAIVNNSLNYEPTITPVLDTSNISEQAGWLDQTLDGQYSMSLAAQNQLEIDHANESSLARQIEDLRTSVQALANKDYSKILEGVNINVDASTNVDGKPLYSRASKHTIQVIDDQERSYIMAKGGRV